MKSAQDLREGMRRLAGNVFGVRPESIDFTTSRDKKMMLHTGAVVNLPSIMVGAVQNLDVNSTAFGKFTHMVGYDEWGSTAALWGG